MRDRRKGRGGREGRRREQGCIEKFLPRGVGGGGGGGVWKLNSIM